ncbi:hypothetical protein ASD8599_02605 [Ascidiaceihabitans donghaensis]|uniref:Uncharacterized protein n=1 Tax=Ascidiaceihabitans donghaensis TaxID=1510460 RepID=A0A2R8BFG5_9RHOB|nr:hypothetical protein ASD8599_02605 [Ascidiaceihabitans donghaensis]
MNRTPASVWYTVSCRCKYKAKWPTLANRIPIPKACQAGRNRIIPRTRPSPKTTPMVPKYSASGGGGTPATWAYLQMEHVDLHVGVKNKGPNRRWSLLLFVDRVSLVTWLFVPVFLLWKNFERVLWGRRRQCPLQRVRVFIPWVGFCHTRTFQQRVGNDAKEEQEGRKA